VVRAGAGPAASSPLLQALLVARAYSHFLSLTNAAEQKHKAHAPDRALFPTASAVDATPQKVLAESSMRDLLARGNTKEQVFQQVRRRRFL
jgi:hypothetical protein